MLEARVAADHVVDDGRAVVGHAQAHRALALRLRRGSRGRRRRAPCTPSRPRRSRSSGRRARTRAAPASASPWRSERAVCRIGPSSQSSSSQRSASRICSMFSGVERSRSVSSMRSTSSPPQWRASSQLNSAVRAPPMCSAPVGDGAKRTLIIHDPRMLIGAHVSPAGGLPKAIERGVERGCRAIQIFNQSPRMWRPTVYRDEDVAAFREAMSASPIDAVLIHAVYLLNCASEDPDIRAKSLASLTHSLRVGRGDRRRGRRAAPGLGQDRRRRRGDRARRRDDPRGARARARAVSCTSRTPPAPAARSGARSTSSPRLLEAAGGERAPRRVPRLLSPARLRL